MIGKNVSLTEIYEGFSQSVMKFCICICNSSSPDLSSARKTSEDNKPFFLIADTGRGLAIKKYETGKAVPGHGSIE